MNTVDVNPEAFAVERVEGRCFYEQRQVLQLNVRSMPNSRLNHKLLPGNHVSVGH